MVLFINPIENKKNIQQFSIMLENNDINGIQIAIYSYIIEILQH